MPESEEARQEHPNRTPVWRKLGVTAATLVLGAGVGTTFYKAYESPTLTTPVITEVGVEAMTAVGLTMYLRRVNHSHGDTG